MSGNHVVTFTDENFETEVLKSDKPVLVDFWAEWCSPCRMMAPTVDALAKEYAGRVKFGKMNVDDSPSTPPRYQVRGIPTLLIFKDGLVADQYVGVTSKDTVVKMLERAL
ncbi:MAG: thioredoxin [Acidobacteria bacterium]|nr:thioredoxin [Acidobacteriota bacterium]